jgi:hypothetical protein
MSGPAPTTPDHKLRDEYPHFKGFGWSDRRIAAELGFSEVSNLHKALVRVGLRQPATDGAESPQEAS